MDVDGYLRAVGQDPGDDNKFDVAFQRLARRHPGMEAYQAVSVGTAAGENDHKALYHAIPWCLSCSTAGSCALASVLVFVLCVSVVVLATIEYRRK